ncbi:MAG: energy transducer TonB [Gammaproteobacteria bacterium]|nr:energy transducer TonB [Gammaproteobacteria bacterium]
MSKHLLVVAALITAILTAEGHAESEPAQSSPESVNVSVVNNASVKLAVLPSYPKRALKNNIDGEVTVEFRISAFGRAIEPRITEASPPRVFNNSVLDTLSYWSFVPARPVACGTVEQTARQTFRFRAGSEKQVHLLPIEIDGQPTLPRGEQRATLEEIRATDQAERQQSQVLSPRGLIATKRVEPVYPDRALQRRLEGVVAVSFLIEKDGTVSQPLVVDSVRGSLFKGSALRAIRQWRFEPAYRDDGESVERTGCHEFIFQADHYLEAQRRKQQREKSNVRIFVPD